MSERPAKRTKVEKNENPPAPQKAEPKGKGKGKGKEKEVKETEKEGKGKEKPKKKKEEEKEEEEEEEEEEDYEDYEDEDEDDADIVEIDLDQNLTAVEIYEMAVDEKSNRKEGVPIKLFEIALSKFEEESHAENISETKKNRLQFEWSKALVDFGKHLSVKEFLELAMEKLEALLKSSPSYRNARFELGHVSLALATLLHEEAIEQAEEQQESDDEEEDQPDVVVPPTTKEISLVTKGLEQCESEVKALGDGLPKMTLLTTFAEALMKYAKVQDEARKQEFIKLSMDRVAEATSLHEKLSKKDSPEELVRLQGLNLFIWGCCLASMASGCENEDPQKAKSILDDSMKKLEEAKGLAPHLAAEAFENMGLVEVALSNLQVDDDDMFVHYDRGLELMKKSIKLNPGNHKLRSTLRALTIPFKQQLEQEED